MGVGCFVQKREGWVWRERLFYFGNFSRYSPGGVGRRLYAPPVETTAPSAPGTAKQRRPCQMQGRPCKERHTRPDVDTPGRSRRRRRWMAGNSSIMRIVIALSLAWSSDSNMHNYHINLLLYLVIVICYQVLDLPP